MPPGPRSIVEAPELVPPLYGLLHTFEPSEPGDRWINGGTFEPLGCGDDVEIVEICPPSPVTKGAGETQANVDVLPFVVVAPDTCSAFGAAARDFEARARRKLEACQSSKIENELWTGDLISTNPRLASTDSLDISGGTADSAPDGLAIMEGALSNCGCGTRGVIHVTRKTASLLTSQGLISPVNEAGFRRPILQTRLGSIVVAGTGYPGTSPAGVSTPGTDWMYGTGMVNIALGPVELFPRRPADTLEWDENTVTVRAERAAMTWFDPCCLIAVSVTVPITPAGS